MRRILLAAAVYAGMGGVGVFWASASGRSPIALDAPWWPMSPVLAASTSIGLGVALALAVIVATRVLVRRTRWARELHLGFRDALGQLSGAEIAFFALSSGIAEELFFRGAMQPSWGLWPTALVFGVLHVPPTRRFLPWTLTAGVMGLALGALYAATGSLAGPIVAHVLINYENLHFIEGYDPSAAPRPRKPTPPSLVHERLRAGTGEAPRS